MSKELAPKAGSRRAPARLDPVDLKMLEILRDDGRISISALAEAVNVSRANAYARLERLRAEGVIEGFSARVNYARVGLGVSAITFLNVRQPAREVLTPRLNEIPGIEHAAFVTGQHDVLLLMRAPDVESLRDETMSKLYFDGSPVQGTNTVFVLDEVVRRPYVLPPSE